MYVDYTKIGPLHRGFTPYDGRGVSEVSTQTHLNNGTNILSFTLYSFSNVLQEYYFHCDHL